MLWGRRGLRLANNLRGNPAPLRITRMIVRLIGACRGVRLVSMIACRPSFPAHIITTRLPIVGAQGWVPDVGQSSRPAPLRITWMIVRLIGAYRDANQALGGDPCPPASKTTLLCVSIQKTPSCTSPKNPRILGEAGWGSDELRSSALAPNSRAADLIPARYFNNSSKICRVRVGSALPRILRITWPTNQPIRVVFPPL